MKTQLAASSTLSLLSIFLPLHAAETTLVSDSPASNASALVPTAGNGGNGDIILPVNDLANVILPPEFIAELRKMYVRAESGGGGEEREERAELEVKLAEREAYIWKLTSGEPGLMGNTLACSPCQCEREDLEVRAGNKPTFAGLRCEVTDGQLEGHPGKP